MMLGRSFPTQIKFGAMSNEFIYQKDFISMVIWASLVLYHFGGLWAR